MNARVFRTLSLSAAVLIGAAIVSLPLAASAASYTGGYSATTATPGATVAYSGTGPDSSAGTATFDGASGSGAVFTTASATSYTFTSSATGAVRFNLTIPASAQAGQVYTSVVVVGGITLSSSTITIVAVPSSGLASTGMDAGPLLWFGGGLVVIGAGAIVLTVMAHRSRSNAARRA